MAKKKNLEKKKLERELQLILRPLTKEELIIIKSVCTRMVDAISTRLTYLSLMEKMRGTNVHLW